MGELEGRTPDGSPALYRLAGVLSHLFSPAGVSAWVCGLLGWSAGSPPRVVLLGVALLAIAPAGALLALAARHRLDDVYDPPPALRQRFLQVGTAFYSAGYAAFELLELEPLLRWAAASFALGAGAVWLIDRRWKISIHNTGAAGGAALLGSAVAPSWWVLWCAVPVVVGWARYQRGAHSPAQLVAGAALGGGVALLLKGWYL